MTKRILILVGVFLVGIMAVAVYLEDRAADRVRISAGEGRETRLERGGSLIPLNDRVFHERGKALFERGLNRLGETGLRDADFRSAHKNFVRALVLNPFSPTTHFDFAQALQYMNALDLPFPERYFDEFRKAATLSGVDHSIYLEVGKVLLSRWPSLLPEERRFAGDIVRTLLASGNQKRAERLEVFLRLWELNIQDTTVLEKILPEDAESYRQAARFLGEKSLQQEARLALFSQAESFDFKKAGEEDRSAQSDLRALRVSESIEHFRTAKKILEGILFYQNLSSRVVIDPEEFKALSKTIRLGIVKCGIETSRKLDDIVEDLEAYLAEENILGAVGELESLLKTRGLIDDKLRLGVQDFIRFSFKMALNFKQNRFREVVQAGHWLNQNILVGPENQRAQYGRLFEIAGDACRRLDDMYESSTFYEKAIALGVADIGLRLKMRRNYERLNDATGLKTIQPLILERLTPRNTSLEGLTLIPGEAYSSTLALEEKKYRMTLTFSDFSVDPSPLITIIFNGRVIWEDYVRSAAVEVELPAVMGMNRLSLTAVNRVAHPALMVLIPEGESPTTAGAALIPKKISLNGEFHLND